MEKKIENYIDTKVKEIISSPSYKDIKEEKRNSLEKDINLHLEKIVIETFINRLSNEEAEELNLSIKKNPEEALEKLRKMAFLTPNLAEDLEKRLTKEVEKFKSL